MRGVDGVGNVYQTIIHELYALSGPVSLDNSSR
jgi:hypothetical protein